MDLLNSCLRGVNDIEGCRSLLTYQPYDLNKLNKLYENEQEWQKILHYKNLQLACTEHSTGSFVSNVIVS